MSSAMPPKPSDAENPDARAGLGWATTLRWYEATGAGVADVTIEPDRGRWTWRAVEGSVERTGGGVIDPALAAQLLALAERVRPEDDLGGPDLSACGTQRLDVADGERALRCEAGASEDLPGAAGEIVAIIREMVSARGE